MSLNSCRDPVALSPTEQWPTAQVNWSTRCGKYEEKGVDVTKKYVKLVISNSENLPVPPLRPRVKLKVYHIYSFPKAAMLFTPFKPPPHITIRLPPGSLS